MRSLFAVLLLAFGFHVDASAQTCTGLCMQQVTCTGSATTTISGTVYAPNGTDPLPNVTVYIPNAPVDAFTPGVSCPVTGTPPSGSPLVGTTSGVDGKFILANVPVGANIPLVIVSGRWRRQVVVPATTGCADTAFDTRFPRNASEGDIPKIAIATGSVDQVECVLRKVGIDASEFTNPSGSGRINFYQGDGSRTSGGAIIDTSTPTETTLMGDATNATLTQYDVLMLPCEGGNFLRSSQQLSNLIKFADSGGRVYSSHYAYSWMYNNPPFNTVANWNISNRATAASGTATVDTTFTEGRTLSSWLQLVGATTTPGQMDIFTIKHDLNGVTPASQSWLTLNSSLDSDSKPVMQFVFNTPVTAKVNQCGRVLFNEYHVENGSSSFNATFPNECSSATTMTPQEKLLEFSLFELTDDGGQATLSPATADFGSEPVGFTTAPQTFTWTNNSTFASAVSLATTSGDFSITSNTCGSIAPGASCQLTVVFKPTALGARTGVLSVGAGAQTLTAALTGTGVPDLTASPTTLTFGNVDVGASVSQTITVTSNAPSAVPFPALATTGDYSVASSCGSSVPALGSCVVTITFKPTTTGARPGTMGSNPANPAYAGLSTTMTGNGVDFTISVTPATGSTIAGYGSTTVALVTPIAGFASPVNLTCKTNAVASTCVPVLVSFVPSTPVTSNVAITTTSQYVVVGYTGLGGGWLSLLAAASGWLMWKKRKSAGTLLRCALALCFLTASSFLITGCSGKLPAQNPSFTAPGDYTYTLTATDGFLVHSATYTLHLTAK